MPIQFACPSCARGYRVKDELAGRSAKCGQCGHKMTIPAAGAKVAAAAASATKSAAPAVAKSAAAKSLAAKPVAAKPLAAKVSAAPAAKAKPVKAPAQDPGTSSWLDEELESARVEAKTKPAAPPPLTSDTACPSCNTPISAGAVICVKCGYDKRIRGRRSVEHVDEDQASPKRSKLGHMGSLLRGSFFSFLGAMVGAIIWAVLAYATLYEFSIVAWGLGGLAGLGMALGHEDNDGTFAGIIAAFMSLLGIVAAKVFIVIIFIAAAVSAIVSEMPLEADGEGFDVVAIQRSALANSLAMEELEAGGESIADVDDERWEQVFEKAKADVAKLPPEEVEKRLNELGEEHGLEDDFDDSDEELAADEMGDAGDAAPDANDDAEGAEFADDAPTFGSVVGSLFGPMDGLWILLAFFTAYKVGSGQAED